ncbi:hypothetical protein HSX11_23000 [Oxalobacteraceae bacterium]|nr:hypothetical protein [Oxalobacteraceae bacterium]
MRQLCFKLSALCAVALATGCATTSSTSQQDEAPPPANPVFVGEMAKFNAQFPNDKAMKYEDISLAFNNEQKLDEKGNCHDLSKYPVTIILVLDANGKVSSATTDVKNKKADCFLQSYASAQFPKPPSAPYRKPIRLK